MHHKQVNEITIKLEGPPIAWKRAGVFRAGKKVIHYDQQKAEKEMIGYEMTSALNRCPKEARLFLVDSPLCVDMTFYLPVDDRQTEKLRNLKYWKALAATNKPDIDNLMKFYFDAANGILWPDDKKIVCAKSKKVYSENPMTVIKISELRGFHGVDQMVRKVLEIVSPEKMKSIGNHVEKIALALEKGVEKNLAPSEEEIKEDWITELSLSILEMARQHAEDFRTLAKLKE